jgi:hypothetical protein
MNDFAEAALQIFAYATSPKGTSSSREKAA